jgi:hypothetical protein
MITPEERARELILRELVRTGSGLTLREFLGFVALHTLCVLLGAIGVVALLISLYEFWWSEWLSDGTLVVSAAATVWLARVLFKAVTARRARLVLTRLRQADPRLRPVP